jgi:hypothetical protein
MKPIFLAATLVAAPVLASPFADSVVDYTPGAFGPAGNAANDPAAALGEPTRQTAGSGAITPFNSTFDPTTFVSLGEGGSLTLSFDEPVVDNPPNVQFGIDLLLFGNGFFYQSDFGTPPDPRADAIFGDGGTVEVSADGVNFVQVATDADGATDQTINRAFPTLGFGDVDLPLDFGFDGVDLPAGTVPTDFTVAVDPAYDASGQTFSQILAAYNGSGGGLGIDLAGTGLSAISFVRITNDNPIGSGITPEIDAVADVIPEPGSFTLLAAAALSLVRRR